MQTVSWERYGGKQYGLFVGTVLIVVWKNWGKLWKNFS